MTWLYTYFILISFTTAWILTRAMRSLALQWRFLDHPADRKIHVRPTPMMGGVALWLTFFGILWSHQLGACLLAKNIVAFSWVPPEILSHLNGILRQTPKLALITLGGTVLAAVGLYDDRFHISPKTKLLWQIGVAVLIVLGGIRLHLFLNNPWAAGILSVLWLVALINAFNLLDNMDGLSAGVALIAAALFAGIAVESGQFFLATSLLIVCGMLAGFLCFNFHPASIFMGDCGSQLLGYLMAVFTILETFYSPRFPTHFPVLMPLLILAVPLYDTSSVIVLRTWRRESIFKADKRHFSHRLNALGMNVRGTVLFIYLVTLTLGLSAPLLPFLSPRGAWVLFLQAISILTVIALLEYFGERKLEGKKS